MADENSVELGKVVPSYLGDWDSTKTYSKLDTVVYNNASYIAVKNVPAGIVPTTDTNSWSVISRGAIGPKGDTGPQGTQGIQGPQGPQGPQGNRGYNFWTMKMTAGGNISGRWISDLYNASKTNLPVVGDTVLQPDGNVYKITGVSYADDGSNGGGTFSLGDVLFSTKGPKGDMDLSQINVGGRNLLTNTDKDVSVTSHTTEGWPAWAHIDTGFSFENGKTYTFSAEAKNSTDKIAEASIRVFEESTNTQVGIYAFPADGKRHSVTFTIPNDSHNYNLIFYAGHAGIDPGVDLTTTYHHPKLEVGNVATDWSPAPEDADSTYVKKSGVETIDGDKTFTGNETFTQPINGALSTRLATFTDFNDVARNMIKYSGSWVIAAQSIANSPLQNYYTAKITPGFTGGTDGYIELVPFANGQAKKYIAVVGSGTLSAWKLFAFDDDVVHKTGNETVAGDKTLTGNTTLANIKSSSIKTANVTMGLLTLHFQQTAVGVNVYVDGTWSGTFSMSDSYISSGISIPSVISKPQLPVVLNIISNGGIGGVTTNSPLKLEVLIDTDGVIKYRAKTLRDNDTTARNSSIVGADSTFYAVG